MKRFIRQSTSCMQEQIKTVIIHTEGPAQGVIDQFKSSLMFTVSSRSGMRKCKVIVLRLSITWMTLFSIIKPAFCAEYLTHTQLKPRIKSLQITESSPTFFSSPLISFCLSPRSFSVIAPYSPSVFLFTSLCAPTTSSMPSNPGVSHLVCSAVAIDPTNTQAMEQVTQRLNMESTVVCVKNKHWCNRIGRPTTDLQKHSSEY